MTLLPPMLRHALRANAINHRAAQTADSVEPDPVPVVKFFNPLGPATWLATELDADGDTMFGLADLGFGCPEMGSFSFGEISRIRLPLGLFIERDIAFETRHPLSIWADMARHTGSIPAAEQRLAQMPIPAPDPLPPVPEPDGLGKDG